MKYQSRTTTKEQAKEQGFTIVELMIATTILSVILVMVTVVMTGIGNLYYKGVNQARVQDDARTITDDISEHLQLGGTVQVAPNSVIDPNLTQGGVTVNALCIDNTRYTYVTNVQIGHAASVSGAVFDHVLWRDTLVTGSPCYRALLTSADPTAGTGGKANTGSELIAPLSRLTILNSSTTSPYSLNVGVAFGDPTITSGSGLGTTCNNGPGDQFCAVASLSTAVAKRDNQ